MNELKEAQYTKRQQLDYIIDNQPNMTALHVNITSAAMTDDEIKDWFTKVRQKQIKSIKESLEES